MKRKIILKVLVIWTVSTTCRAEVLPIVKLASPEPAPYHNYGWSVSLNGPTALISANNSSFPGIVYVYRSDGEGSWSNLASLIPPDSQIGDGFGWSTSLSDSTALIGAPQYGTGGAAYILEEDQTGDWSQVAKLTPTGAVNENGFLDIQFR